MHPTLTMDLNLWYVIAALIAAVFGAAGVIGTQWYNRARAKAAVVADTGRREREDDLLSDLLNRLVQEEADKRISVIKMDFELKMTKAEVAHQKELTGMRKEFEGKLQKQAEQIGALARSLSIRGCDLVDCPNRVKTAGFIAVGGTDAD